MPATARAALPSRTRDAFSLAGLPCRSGAPDRSPVAISSILLRGITLSLDSMGLDPRVRRATNADVDSIGRLLHDFNTEYNDVTPGPRALAERVRELFDHGDTVVLLAGSGPDGLA